MEPVSLAQLQPWTGGRLISGPADAAVTNVCTDSRALKAGDLFLALRGDNFDGHRFVAEAALRGAVGAVVEELDAEVPAGFGLIQVADSLRALQQMAGEYRRTLPMQVVAITGSNGKTSTKDLVASVLGAQMQVTRTLGNLNNHIGLPLSLLRSRASDQVGIFELGMNHPGEIAPLAELAAPDLAIITNIGMAHIEYMGSREAIALEKGMLAEALPATGHLILNANDSFSRSIAARSRATAIYCGIDEGDIQARSLEQSFSGTEFMLRAQGRELAAQLPVPGVHMVGNALLAVAAGLTLGLSLEQCVTGLAQLQLTKGRLEQKLIAGLQILDDTYNANPDSVTAALRTLSGLPGSGRRIAVLGRMGELGSHSEDGHRRVGEVAAEVGVDLLIGVGEETVVTVAAAQERGVKEAISVPSIEAAVACLRQRAHAGDLVLVKGSRSARMERIVEGLQGV